MVSDESSLLKLAVEVGSPQVDRRIGKTSARWHLGTEGRDPAKNYLAVVNYFDKENIYEVGFLLHNREALPLKETSKG